MYLVLFLAGYFKFCSRNDPAVHKCLKSKIQLALPNLAYGIPEFGLKSIDPYWKKFVKIEYVNGLVIKSFI